MRHLPLATRDKLAATREMRKRRVIVPAVDPSRKVEISYRKELEGMIAEIEKDLKQAMKESGMIMDSPAQPGSFATRLAGLIDGLITKYTAGRFAVPKAEQFIRNAAQYHKDQSSAAITKATGVDLMRIIHQEKLAPALNLKVEENVDLIKTIPQTLLGRVKAAVLRNATAGASPVPLVDQIQAISGSTYSRAKLIARDQTAKTNASLTELRDEALGITEYRWMTSRDERVRPSHRAKQGQIFRYDDPPADTGNPGHDYQCRCVAQAIIDLDKLL